jgi:hypothetical protein
MDMNEVLIFVYSNIIWVSDLNYRVSLPNEDVRQYANEGNIDMLLQNDQVSERVSV